MVRQPSTDAAEPRTLNRRRYLAIAGAAGLAGATGLGAARPADAQQETASPPGVSARREYEQLRITGVAPSHGGGRVFVGRRGTRPAPDDPVRIAVVGPDGEARLRIDITPDLLDDAHATPGFVRTGKGYAVAAGPWLVRLAPDLSVLSVGKGGSIPATQRTTLIPVDGGFVVGFSESLPNAFWTWLVGFDGDGSYAWHHRHNVNGSQALEFLVPDGDGGAIAGGTFPWLARVSADGEFEPIDLPEDLPSGVLQTGIRDGDGLLLCSGDTTARLDADFALDWTREYESVGEQQARELQPDRDGFVARTTGEDATDFGLMGIDAEGSLRWQQSYDVDDDRNVDPRTLAVAGDGTYLVAGGYNEGEAGWAFALSQSVSPSTPTPTATERTTRASTDPPTALPTPAGTTTTTVPGFGVATAFLGLGASLAGLLGRDE